MESSRTQRRSYLPVDTKGHCFLCLSSLELGSSVFQPHYPFQGLSRYLKLNVNKILDGAKGSTSTTRSLSGMVIALCEECASVNDDVSELNEQLEDIELKMINCLQRIHGKLEEVGEGHMRKLFGADSGNRKEEVKFALGLRQEVMEKCSQTLCSGSKIVQEFERTAARATAEQQSKSNLRSATRRKRAQEVIQFRKSNPENVEEPELSNGEDYIKTEVSEDYLTMDDEMDNPTSSSQLEFDCPASPQSNVGSDASGGAIEDTSDADDGDDSECGMDDGVMREVKTRTKGLKVFPGGRKHYTITYRGYTFVPHADGADKRITRCTRHPIGCRVRLHLNRSWTRVISKHSPDSHNHPSEEAKCERRYAMWKLRSAAKASCAESIETIIETALDGVPDPNQGPFQKLPTLKRFVHRMRRSEQIKTGITPKPKATITRSTLCDHCGKEFKLRAHLLAHVNSVHLRIRENQCDLCGRGFFDKRNLTRHRQSIHFGDGKRKRKAKDVSEPTKDTNNDTIIEPLEIDHV